MTREHLEPAPPPSLAATLPRDAAEAQRAAARAGAAGAAGRLEVQRAGSAGALLRSMRPRQWPKNALVFAAPTAAGVMTHAGALGRTVASLGIFIAASACVYLVNDVVDKASDQLHPLKRRRPIASGQVTTRQAIVAAVVLGAGALGASVPLAGSLVGIVAAYLAISIAYSLRLKHVPIVELACVGSGFMLRAIAGGAATHVPISPWFLVMTSFGALFVVAGKRTTEQQVLGEGQGGHRVALTAYPPEFLRGVRRLAMSITVMTYCLWALERASHLHPAGHAPNLVWFELSIVPFVLAVLGVELAVLKGRGGEPEELVMSDRLLQMAGLAWLALVLIGIYG